MKPLVHLDLFSGIGGFALAVDNVWDDVEHIFCDNEPFAREVLKKHWPESEIYDDIRAITADSYISRYIHRESEKQPTARPYQAQRQSESGARSPSVHILTGGFPCQPFSAAGLRRGTADERHLWPEMLRVIRLTKPKWVIAENVRGLATWNDGMVLEQVCADLEAAGYAVQPIIIPAVAVNAPHRRDRIWFIAHASGRSGEQSLPRVDEETDGSSSEVRQEGSRTRQPVGTTRLGAQGATDSLQDSSGVRERELITNPRRQHGESGSVDQHQRKASERSPQTTQAERHTPDDTHAKRQGRSGQRHNSEGQPRQPRRERSGERPDWGSNWAEVATRLCSVDDGLPTRLGGLELSKPQHRAAQLKAYGNAIVPQVAEQIMRSFAGDMPM